MTGKPKNGRHSFLPFYLNRHLHYEDSHAQKRSASTVDCFTMTVSRTLSNDDDVVTRYMCAKDWFYDTIYREEIVLATTTITSSTTGEWPIEAIS